MTETIQRKPAAAGGLPDPLRGQMERSLGADFSGVRVHVDGRAEALGADAYASGSDIHLAPGKYDPASREGQELIGHELAHVVQQRKGRAGGGTEVDGVRVVDDPALESEADQAGARAADGASAPEGGVRVAPGGAHGAPVQLDRGKKKKKRSDDDGAKDDKEDKGTSLGGAFKAVGEVLGTIDKIHEFWDKYFESKMDKGQVTAGPILPDLHKLSLDRIFNNLLAKEVVNYAFEVGNTHGIDLKKYAKRQMMERRKQQPTSAKTGGGAPDKDTGAGPNAGATGTEGKSEPAVRDDEELTAEKVEGLTGSLQMLKSLVANDLAAKARAQLEKMMPNQPRLVTPQSFYWTADDQSGTGRLKERGTETQWQTIQSGGSGDVTVKITPGGLAGGGAMGGLPFEVEYFGLAANDEWLEPRWAYGCAVDYEVHDDLNITATVEERPHVNVKQGGAYHVHTKWVWDASTTTVECDAHAATSSVILANQEWDGTPDDGWW